MAKTEKVCLDPDKRDFKSEKRYLKEFIDLEIDDCTDLSLLHMIYLILYKHRNQANTDKTEMAEKI